jgi:hypothetical protein
MTYRYQDRIKYLPQRMRENVNEIVLYAVGNYSGYVPATPGHTDVQDLIVDVPVSQARYVDFLITATDLVLPTLGLTIPARDHNITWKGTLYRVLQPAQNEDAYQLTTQFGDSYRIHTIKAT